MLTILIFINIEISRIRLIFIRVDDNYSFDDQLIKKVMSKINLILISN